MTDNLYETAKCAMLGLLNSRKGMHASMDNTEIVEINDSAWRLAEIFEEEAMRRRKADLDKDKPPNILADDLDMQETGRH